MKLDWMTRIGSMLMSLENRRLQLPTSCRNAAARRMKLRLWSQTQRLPVVVIVTVAVTAVMACVSFRLNHQYQIPSFAVFD